MYFTSPRARRVVSATDSRDPPGHPTMIGIEGDVGREPRGCRQKPSGVQLHKQSRERYFPKRQASTATRTRTDNSTDRPAFPASMPLLHGRMEGPTTSATLALAYIQKTISPCSRLSMIGLFEAACPPSLRRLVAAWVGIPEW